MNKGTTIHILERALLDHLDHRQRLGVQLIDPDVYAELKERIEAAGGLSLPINVVFTPYGVFAARDDRYHGFVRD
jgi:hypothetical protein